MGHGGAAQCDADLARLLFQGIEQKAVLDHMGERLARLDVAREGEENRTHGVVDAAVGHDHVEDRLCLVGDALPNAERLKQPARRGDNGGGAFVAGVAFAERRVGDRDRGRGAQALPQRDRQRQPGKAAAGDQHVASVVFPGHAATTASRTLFLDAYGSIPSGHLAKHAFYAFNITAGKGRYVYRDNDRN